MPDPTTTTTTTTEATPAGAAATTTATIKPGMKTSEFAMNVAALVLSACFAVDLFPTGSVYAKIAIIAAITFTSMGYTVARAKVKSGVGGLALVLFAFSMMATAPACSGAGDRIRAGGRAFLDCMAPSTKSAADELVPALKTTVVGMLDSSGKIDRAALGSVAAPMKTAIPRCALDAAIAAVLNPPAPLPGAPASSPLEVDETDVAGAYADVRASLWGGVEVRSAQ